MNPITLQAPVLASPGAGLPAPELLVAKLLLQLTCVTGSREKFTAQIDRERNRVVALSQACDDTAGSRRILIKRIVGMEDSSRYWSVWMTLDHLRIVNLGIARTIESLGQGTVAPGQASTAAVKPSPTADASALDEFRASCAVVINSANVVPDLKATPRYTHPWFGPMNAYGWYAIAAFHLNLHRRQIERILAVP